jgi:hypothetical protein
MDKTMTMTMTPEQIDALSGDELRIAVAKAMGWTGIETRRTWLGEPYLGGNPPEWDADKVSEKTFYNATGIKGLIPNYSRHIDSVWKMEEYISTQGGMRLVYARLLMAVIEADNGYPEEGHKALLPFKLIHATPSQRCRAFLRAINDEVA